MKRIGVMQVTDTLALGGLERVAVNLANCLPTTLYRSFLCSTREGGPLNEELLPHVQTLHLKRAGRFDTQALRQFAAYIEENQIHILHAHGTSLFFAALASFLRPHPVVLWHDHFGRSETEQRPAWLYQLAAKRADGVIAVNQKLAQWSEDKLGIPGQRVWYIPNFVCEPRIDDAVLEMPGIKGSRIVCVANLRPEKDHPNLLQAMNLVIREFPSAHLLLVGAVTNTNHLELIENTIAREHLQANVTWLGSRKDVSAILKACDVGVLSSSSEGLPLALIEYGMAGLPAIATNVGQCAEVLDGGRAGILVAPSSPQCLATAIVSLLRSEEQREAFAATFSHRVRSTYGAPCVIAKICEVYDTLLNAPANASEI